MGIINSSIRRKQEEPVMVALSAEVVQEPIAPLELPEPEPVEVVATVEDAPKKKKKRK